MTALGAAAGTVFPLVPVPAALDALHAEVVSAGNSRGVPEDPAADPTAEAIHLYWDTRHV